jgi:plastocyanin
MPGVLRSVVLSMMAVSLAACGNDLTAPDGGIGGGGNLVATTEVTVADFSFTPPAIAVAPGATVIWTWASGTHNVTFSGGQMTSHATETAPWIRASVAPTTPGTYNYSCTLHPGLMTGSVTVLR